MDERDILIIVLVFAVGFTIAWIISRRTTVTAITRDQAGHIIEIMEKIV